MVAKRLDELGMEAYSFHAPFVDVDISSLDLSHREYSFQELMTAAEAASILNVRQLIIHPDR
jgi:endonuclease IV